MPGPAATKTDITDRRGVVLVVDDSPESLGMINEALETAGRTDSPIRVSTRRKTTTARSSISSSRSATRCRGRTRR